jgi:vanillate/3-O-methylgallate O-demethylase
MAKLNLERYQDDYRRSLNWQKPFHAERPPSFSPAAEAQENHGQNSMLWKFISQWIPWQYTNFIDESLSFHNTAYLGDWSSLTKFRIKGPDALKFLTGFCVNDVRKFRPGQIKHAIQTDRNGKVAGEGILYKLSDEEYQYSGGGAYWLDYWFQQTFKENNWDAEARINSADHFVFVIQGPRSLDVMESVTGGKFRDLKFSYTRMTTIGDYAVRILRTGELGYEIHGSPEIGNDVWNAIRAAGEPYGLRLLGGRSQLISHVEGCYPTIGRDFWPATDAMGHSHAHRIDPAGGSYEWSDLSELTRSPLELGWDREVSLDTHDFLGREALIAEKNNGGPARRIVGLIWNKDDVIDVFASLFRDDEGERFRQMDMPRTIVRHAIDPDKVTKNSKVVGCSTSRIYSSFLRKMISLCVIDRSLTERGTEVVVVWGNKGGPQKEIRATVRAVPFKEDKRRIDVTML